MSGPLDEHRSYVCRYCCEDETVAAAAAGVVTGESKV